MDPYSLLRWQQLGNAQSIVLESFAHGISYICISFCLYLSLCLYLYHNHLLTTLCMMAWYHVFDIQITGKGQFQRNWFIRAEGSRCKMRWWTMVLNNVPCKEKYTWEIHPRNTVAKRWWTMVLNNDPFKAVHGELESYLALTTCLAAPQINNNRLTLNKM